MIYIFYVEHIWKHPVDHPVAFKTERIYSLTIYAILRKEIYIKFQTESPETSQIWNHLNIKI